MTTSDAHNLGVFDRALAGDLRREWTERIAAPIHHEIVGTESVVIFRVGAEWLALSTPLVGGIAPVRVVHSLPHGRDGVEVGVANIDGELIICISLTALLGIAAAGATGNGEALAARRMIVAFVAGGKIVFPVDEVHGVHRYRTDQIAALPATLGNAANRHMSGIVSWREWSVGRIDEARLSSLVTNVLG